MFQTKKYYFNLLVKVNPFQFLKCYYCNKVMGLNFSWFNSDTFFERKRIESELYFLAHHPNSDRISKFSHSIGSCI